MYRCDEKEGAELENGGKECYRECNTQQGKCNWCGPDGWCCRKDWVGNGCDGTIGGPSNHQCVLNSKSTGVITNEESEVARYLTSNAKPCLGIDELIKGCDEDYRGSTVLQVASSYGYLPLVRKLLIEDQQDVNDFGRDGFKRSALHYVALSQNDHTNVAKFLITNGAMINAKDKDESTPLHFAARSGNVGIVKLLIENGAIIDAQKKYRYTPLFETIKTSKYVHASHAAIAKILIKNGANIDMEKEDGYTPLHEAAWASNTEMVNMLIDQGANVNIRDQWGQSALDIAKRGGLAGTDGIENIKPELIKKIEGKLSGLVGTDGIENIKP